MDFFFKKKKLTFKQSYGNSFVNFFLGLAVLSYPFYRFRPQQINIMGIPI